MICPPCADALHEDCEWPESCTCQHKAREEKNE